MAVHASGEGGYHPAPLLPDIAYICKRGSVESHSLAGACVVYALLDKWGKATPCFTTGRLMLTAVFLHCVRPAGFIRIEMTELWFSPGNANCRDYLNL